MFFLWNRHYFVKTKTDLQVEAEKNQFKLTKRYTTIIGKEKAVQKNVDEKKTKIK